MPANLTTAIRENYSRIADEIARHLFQELEHKPLDRQLLDRFATRIVTRGEVCDMGCGPGHVPQYLHNAGAIVFGLDLSLEMLNRLGSATPAFPSAKETCWLSPSGWHARRHRSLLCHREPKSLPKAFREMARALQPGGALLLAFHAGSEILKPAELWGRPISMDFFFFDPSAVAHDLQAAGFEIEDVIERAPTPRKWSTKAGEHTFSRESPIRTGLTQRRLSGPGNPDKQTALAH